MNKIRKFHQEKEVYYTWIVYKRVCVYLPYTEWLTKSPHRALLYTHLNTSQYFSTQYIQVKFLVSLEIKFKCVS